MEREIDEIAEFMVWMVSDFARLHGLSDPQAYDYLHRYGGISFMEDYYDVLHTFSMEQAVEDIGKYCARNGGTLS